MSKICATDARHVVVAVASLMGLGFVADDPPVAKTPSRVAEIPDSSYESKRGDRALVYSYSKKHDSTYLTNAFSESFAYREYWEALDIDDDAGIREVKSGRYYVPLAEKTPVLVLEIETYREKDPRADCAIVRVLGGPQEGKRLWVARFDVVKLIPNPNYNPTAALAKQEFKQAPLDTDASESLARAEKLRASGQLGAALDAYRFIELGYRNTPAATKAREQIERIEKEMAKKLDDTKAARLLTLAKNLDKSGKTAAALDYYAQVVKAAPKSKEAAEASRRMAELRK